ncbi:hypothetical protein [Limosilactobacillus antri]|uniref:hypothetical protein n=1 Tax=Limosilactobacillus antri TaxID=227943 RepID=UPI001F5A84E7|nr:hypothetical protein [Limosilactobacillus antri]
MAQRRMFSKTIVESTKFLKMPLTTQALYYHLGMYADDDGVVEAFTVLRITGASEDDLKILVAKKFAVVLNDDLVTYLPDWLANNHLRPDRKHSSAYLQLLREKVPEAQVLASSKPKKDNVEINGQASARQLPADCQTLDGHVSGKCQPNVGLEVEEKSIGEVSIDKYRREVEEDSEGKSSLPSSSNSNLINQFIANYQISLNNTQRNKISEYAGRIRDDRLIIHAMQEAMSSNRSNLKMPFNYFEAIVKRYIAENISFEDIQHQARVISGNQKHQPIEEPMPEWAKRSAEERNVKAPPEEVDEVRNMLKKRKGGALNDTD